MDVIRSVIVNGTRSPIIFTTGYTCRDAFSVRDAPNHLYMTGSMGMAPVIGVGVARHTPRTTIVVDGDGALLMNPAAMLVVRQYLPGNYLHVLLDNGRYESTGGQRTSSSLFDIPDIATAIGYPRCTRLREPAELGALPELVDRPRGPHLVYVRVGPRQHANDRGAPRVVVAPAANFRRFQDWLQNG
ncbi:MAG TPA: thiamine pyrophosphate-dependent enzyme [Pseudonocardiaceae bacterium]|nr:thiamine pyrophosphate-dependent enzyme [Pseudonocardiaceae bacterium]